MKNLDLIQKISDANASGRGYSSAPWNIFCNTLFNPKKVQSGRSMIEMLGVLAIIGVLSVGGIAGYSKAMKKYRINKTIEQITLIAGNMRAFFAPQKNYAGLNSYSSTGKAIIRKAKLVPDEMWNDNSLENIFGGELSIQGIDNKASIILYGISADVCIELAIQDWNISMGFFVVDIWNHDDEVTTDAINACPLEYDGDEEVSVCANSAYGSEISLSLDTAVKACSCENNNCAFQLGFK